MVKCQDSQSFFIVKWRVFYFWLVTTSYFKGKLDSINAMNIFLTGSRSLKNGMHPLRQIYSMICLSGPPSRPLGCRAFDGRCSCEGPVRIFGLEGGPRPPRRGTLTWGSPSSPARPAIPREWPWRGFMWASHPPPLVSTHGSKGPFHALLQHRG